MPRHLLVVDDSPQITDLLVQYLEGQGFSVAAARNGKEALNCVNRRPPDLILLDVMMPGMDGFEFMRRLRPQRRGSRDFPNGPFRRDGFAHGFQSRGR